MKSQKIFVALIAVLVAMAFAPSADAQIYRRTAAISNSVMLVTASSNLLSTQIRQVDISPKGQGISFSALMAATNSASVNVGFNFAVTVDNTNYNTVNTWWYVAALNGTAGVVTYTNFPTAAIANATKIKLLAITNAHTSSVFITNAYFGQVFDR